jgi:hypothetical protein
MATYFADNTYSTSEFTMGVAPNGTFVKNPSMNGWPTGINGIPEGWTVVNAN